MECSQSCSRNQADGLGSITSLTNSSSAIANTYTYDSFGKQTASTGTVVNNFRYTARELDVETGLMYYRARFYDPNNGRFISEDPVSFRGGDVDLYDYAANDPVQGSDPTGLWSRAAHDVLLWNAFHPCGVPNWQIWRLQVESANLDDYSGLTKGLGFQHSMLDPGDTPADSIAKRDKFIEQSLQKSGSFGADYDYGGFTQQNLHIAYAGRAMHTLMDSTSPAHVDPATGNPYRWCGLLGCWFDSDDGPGVLRHHSLETPDQITPEIQTRVNEMLRSVYERVNGFKLKCCGK